MAVIKKSSRALIFGGLFFMIPFLIAIVAWKQVYAILAPIGKKISFTLHLHSIFGKASVLIVTLILIFLLCYIAGLLIEKGIVKNWSSNFEKKLFAISPTLQMLKFRLIGDKSNIVNEFWQGIVFKEENTFRIGFITEKKEHFTAVYIPDAPKLDAGELKYMDNKHFEYYNITMKEAMSAIYSFGEGLDIENILKNNDKSIS